MNDIAPDGSRLLFPSCGISYLQVISVAGVNQRHAAKKLGVSERQFTEVIRRRHMQHWFPDVRPRPRCISREDIEKLAAEGYTKRDAAFIAGVEYSYFKELVQLYGLRDLFPNCGEASWISRRGYAK